MELGGRVALVTGGAGGIGGAVVSNLARAGIGGVAINYRKSGKAAEELAADTERAGVQAAAPQADVRRDNEIRRMMAKVRDQFGRLDIRIHHAGITPWVKPSDPEGSTD